MRNIAMFVAAFVVATVCVIGGFSSAQAAAWPPSKLTLVWHSKAGSAGDLMMRALGKYIEKTHKVTVIVENRTGAAGANAWGSVSRAKPDGSILLGVSSTLIASPLQNKMTVNYTSFDPVAQLFTDAICFFVSGTSPYKTLNDFFADAKKRPGDVSLTGGTAGNVEFVAAKQLLREAGVTVPFIPFEGGGEGVVAIIGGHVTAGVGEYSEVQSAAQGGKIRVLAMFNEMPGIKLPSVTESGYKTTVEKFRGILVTKGTPKEIKDAILATLKGAMEDPDFKKFYTMNTLVPTFRGPEEFTKLMENQTADLKASLAEMK